MVYGKVEDMGRRRRTRAVLVDNTKKWRGWQKEAHRVTNEQIGMITASHSLLWEAV